MSGYISDFLKKCDGTDLDFLSSQDQVNIRGLLDIAEYISTHNILVPRFVGPEKLESNIKKLGDYVASRSLAPYEREKHRMDFMSYYPEINTAFHQMIRQYEVDHLSDLVRGRLKYDEDVEAVSLAKETVIQIISEHQLKFDDFISQAKEQLAEIGILDYEQVFGKESKEFETSSQRWLAGLIISIGALVAIGLCFLPEIPSEAAGGMIAQLLFKKIVVITGLFYLVALCSRNYRASKHNALVNKHRQNALKTFQVFMRSVQDDDAATKNAVLLKVTETIFGSQPSGFLPDSGDGDMSPKIIEIFKNFPTTAGK